VKLTFGWTMIAYLAGWALLTWSATSNGPQGQFTGWFWAYAAYTLIIGTLILAGIMTGKIR